MVKVHRIILALGASTILAMAGMAGVGYYKWRNVGKGPSARSCHRMEPSELDAAIAHGFDVNSGCCVEHMIFECAAARPNASWLVYAVEANDLDFATRLLAHGARPHQPTPTGYPLALAVQAGNRAIFDLLMTKPVETAAVQAALVQAVHLGRQAFALALLAHVPTDDRARTCNRMACDLIEEFHQPGHDGHRQIMAAIIADGLEPNARCATEHVITALARNEANYPFVKSLLDRGADLNLPERNGRTILGYLQHFNAYQSRPRMKALLEGADRNSSAP